MTEFRMTVRRKGELVWEGPARTTADALEFWAQSRGYPTFLAMFRDYPLQIGDVKITHVTAWSEGTPSFEEEIATIEREKQMAEESARLRAQEEAKDKDVDP